MWSKRLRRASHSYAVYLYVLALRGLRMLLRKSDYDDDGRTGSGSGPGDGQKQPVHRFA
jgi:hypothetical protein